MRKPISFLLFLLLSAAALHAQTWTEKRSSLPAATTITGTYTPAQANPSKNLDGQEAVFYDPVDQLIIGEWADGPCGGCEWGNALFGYDPATDDGVSTSGPGTGWHLLWDSLNTQLSANGGTNGNSLTSLTCSAGVVTVVTKPGSAQFVRVGQWLLTQGMPTGFSNLLTQVTSVSGATGPYGNLFTTYTYNDATCVNGPGAFVLGTTITDPDEFSDMPQRRHATAMTFDTTRNNIWLSGGIGDSNIDATTINSTHSGFVDLYQMSKASGNWVWSEVCGFGPAVAGSGVAAPNTLAGGPGQLCGQEFLTTTSATAAVAGLPCRDSGPGGVTTGGGGSSCGYKFPYAGYDPTNDAVVIFGGQFNSGQQCEILLYYPATNTWVNPYNPSNCGSTAPAARWNVAGGRLESLGGGKMFLFAGQAGSATFDDTWIFNTNGCAASPPIAPCGWTKVASINNPPPDPDPVKDYDADIGRIVLVDKQQPAHTWFFDPVALQWTDQTTTSAYQGGPFLTTALSSGTVLPYYSNGAFHPVSHKMVVFNTCAATTTPACSSTVTQAWQLSLPTSLAGVSLLPGSANFGQQAVGTPSTAQSFTLSNTSGAGITVNSITTGNAVFVATTNPAGGVCGGTLANGASCTISVVFTPAAQQAYSGTLTVTYNTTVVLTSALSGTGISTNPVATVTPATLTFNAQTVGTTSASQPVTIQNTGGSALSITAIGFTGANPGDYAQTNTCGTLPATLAAGAQCTASVSFVPTVSGTRAANLQITDNSGGVGGSTQTTGLTGTGQTTPPNASLAPASFTFPNTAVSASSAPQGFTLTNSGQQNLVITSIALGGANPGDYAISSTVPASNCGGTLVPAAQCTINIVFSPTTTGSRLATLVTTDNSGGTPGSTQSATLNGFGTGVATSTFSVVVNGPGTVTSTSVPSQGTELNCPTVCSVGFPTTATVTLIPTATGTASFNGWSGDCTGSGSCSLPMTAAHSVTASFTTSTPVTALLTTQEALPGPGITGVIRTNEPVTVGLPVADSASIVGTSQLGCSASPCQLRQLAHWMGSGNAKYVLVDYLDSVAANGTHQTFSLTNGTGNAGTPMSVTDSNPTTPNVGTITVNTGTGGATFIIRKPNFDLVHSAITNAGSHQLVNVGGSSDCGTATTGSGCLVLFAQQFGTTPVATCTLDPSGGGGGSVSTQCDTLYSSLNDAASTCVVEETGPVRTALKCVGALRDSLGNKYMGFVARLHFYTGLPRVKLVVTLKNADDGAKTTFPISHKGYQNFEARLATNLSGTNKWTIGTETAGAPVTGTFSAPSQRAYIYQGFGVLHLDSNYCFNGFPNAASDILRTQASGACTYSQQGYEIVKPDNTSVSGGQTTVPAGWADVQDAAGGQGVEIGAEYMVTNFPRSLQIMGSGQEVIIGISPDQTLWKTCSGGITPCQKIYYQAWPQYKVANVDLIFHDSDTNNYSETGATRAQSDFWRMQYPLIARADPTYYNAAGAFLYPIVKGDTEDAYWNSVNSTKFPSATNAIPDDTFNVASPCNEQSDTALTATVGGCLFFPRNYSRAQGGDTNQINNRWSNLVSRWIGRGQTGRYVMVKFWERAEEMLGWPRADGISCTLTVNGNPQTYHNWACHQPATDLSSNDGYPTQCTQYSQTLNGGSDLCNGSGGMLPNNSTLAYDNYVGINENFWSHAHWWELIDYYYMTGDEDAHDLINEGPMTEFTAIPGYGFRTIYSSGNLPWNGTDPTWQGTAQVATGQSQFNGLGVSRAISSHINGAARLWQYLNETGGSATDIAAVRQVIANNLNEMLTENCATDAAGNAYPPGCVVRLGTQTDAVNSSITQTVQARGVSMYRGAPNGPNAFVDDGRPNVTTADPWSANCGTPPCSRRKAWFFDGLWLDGLWVYTHVFPKTDPDWQRAWDAAYGVAFNTDFEMYRYNLCNGAVCASPAPDQMTYDISLDASNNMAYATGTQTTGTACNFGYTGSNCEWRDNQIAAPWMNQYLVISAYTGIPGSSCSADRTNWQCHVNSSFQNKGAGATSTDYGSYQSATVIYNALNPASSKLQLVGAHAAGGADSGALVTSYSAGAVGACASSCWTLNWTPPNGVLQYYLKEHDTATVVTNIGWDPSTGNPCHQSATSTNLPTVCNSTNPDPTVSRNFWASGPDEPQYLAPAGAPSGTTGPLAAATSFTVSAPSTASFELMAQATGIASTTWPLNITVTGTGTVTSADALINCPGTCAATYNNGSQVVLTATPGGSQIFSGWSGDCAGTGTCSLQMTGGHAATATFNGATAPVVSMSPGSLAFTSTQSTASSAQVVTLTNTGNGTLTIASIGFTGTNPADFAQTTTCGATLAAATSCIINVTFTPSLVGAESASLSVADNAAGSPHTVALSGTGLAPFSACAQASMGAAINGGATMACLALPSSAQVASAAFGTNWSTNNPCSTPANNPWPLDFANFGMLRIWQETARWSTLETARGTYNWTNLDCVTSRAQALSVPPAMEYTVGSYPTWSNGTGGTTALPTDVTTGGVCTSIPSAFRTLAGLQSNDCQFQEFMYNLAMHVCTGCNPGGSVFTGTLGIKYWSTGNEVNIIDYVTNPCKNGQNPTTCQNLAVMSRDAYKILHAVDSSVIVGTPSTTTNSGYNDLGAYLQTTAQGFNPGDFADALIHHCYLNGFGVAGMPENSSTNVNGLASNAQNMMNGYVALLTTANHMSGKPIFCDEGGYGNNFQSYDLGATNSSCGTLAAPLAGTSCIDIHDVANRTINGTVNAPAAGFMVRQYLWMLSKGYSQFHWFAPGADDQGSTAEYGPAGCTVGTTCVYTKQSDKFAYDAMYNWLVGSALGALTNPSGTQYQYNLTGKAIGSKEGCGGANTPSNYTGLIAWDTTGASTITGGNWDHYCTLFEGTTAPYSAGASHVYAGSVTLGPNPILLETAPGP